MKGLVNLRQLPVLVLDNTWIHQAQLVLQRVTGWAASGLPLLFLLPYSPELHRIESLGTLASTTG